MILQAPTGERVTLHDKTGTANKLVTTYDSLTEPHGPGTMYDFDGEVSTGTWHLYVNDLEADMMAGMLDGWSLDFDTDDLCHDAPCSEPLPGEVAPMLELERLTGSDVRLTWEPVADAAGYAVWRSSSPTMSGADTVGRTPDTTLDEIGLPEGPRVHFYQVRAHNGCHDEGP